MNRLNNKVALITGGAKGIGEAIARLFAEEGAKVIITDIDTDGGVKVTKSIGANAQFLPHDVIDEIQWQTVMSTVLAQHGKLDILINNAGIVGANMGPQDPEHATLASWQKVHAINLDSVFLGCKYAINVMKTQKHCAIVNLSSRSGMVGVPTLAAYASSKAAIRNHTKTVALYCASQGYDIRCNSIHPAAILTPLWKPILGRGKTGQENIKAMAQSIPLGTMGEPIDVAYLALYLAADESKYVTGTEFTIDGGILAGSSAAPTSK